MGHPEMSTLAALVCLSGCHPSPQAEDPLLALTTVDNRYSPGAPCLASETWECKTSPRRLGLCLPGRHPSPQPEDPLLAFTTFDNRHSPGAPCLASETWECKTSPRRLGLCPSGRHPSPQAEDPLPTLTIFDNRHSPGAPCLASETWECKTSPRRLGLCPSGRHPSPQREDPHPCWHRRWATSPALGELTEIAKAAGIARAPLYKALRPDSAPRFDTVSRVCTPLEVRLSPSLSIPRQHHLKTYFCESVTSL